MYWIHAQLTAKIAKQNPTRAGPDVALGEIVGELVGGLAERDHEGEVVQQLQRGGGPVLLVLVAPNEATDAVGSTRGRFGLICHGTIIPSRARGCRHADRVRRSGGIKASTHADRTVPHPTGMGGGVHILPFEVRKPCSIRGSGHLTADSSQRVMAKATPMGGRQATTSADTSRQRGVRCAAYTVWAYQTHLWDDSFQ